MTTKVEQNLWDYHIQCEVPRQTKFYKVTYSSYVVECEQTVKSNDQIVAPHDVTGMWDNNSVMVYQHPAIAVCIQPVIEGFPMVEIWECEGEGKLATIEGVVACREITLKKPMLFHLGLMNRIRFASACVSQVQSDHHFSNWLLDWWNKRNGYFTTDEISKISWRLAQKEKLSSTESHKVFAPKAFVYYASHYLAAACLQYEAFELKPEVVQHRVAQAVMYSIYAANQMNIPINIINLVEKAFSVSI